VGASVESYTGVPGVWPGWGTCLQWRGRRAAGGMRQDQTQGNQGDRKKSRKISSSGVGENMFRLRPLE
jgi:hypothetical protein